MKQTINIFLSTYFIIIALLYLTMRYTSFNMNAVLFSILCGLFIIIIVILYTKKQISLNIFTVSLIFLTAMMFLTRLIE
ncbi:hypothetical protein [Lacicoccus qingdaonensis]|uniref:Uncharacterized protein n=1 Tax=Lacicoccus qingdaonensis TaxID=576118 RepID=A0A1G9GPM0_9BACL|nr:hypothetical protein [Salinicoccus qingdaonensis]SDL02614.1 hypothetical protein SAMN05216216_11846 [Salinicoccus qingdaonensis]